MNVESVQDTYSNRSSNKNAGGSIGVFVGMSGNSFGFGIEGSVQAGKGKENSDSITQKNSDINGEEVTLKTGEDANFKGGVVNAEQLKAEIGNNLTIESRQDSNHYDSKQVQGNAGTSTSIPKRVFSLGVGSGIGITTEKMEPIGKSKELRGRNE